MSRGSAVDQKGFRLFAYGTLLAGEREHALLGDSERLGSAATQPLYGLFEVGPYAAMVAGGSTSVRGDLYLVSRETLLAIDVARQVPLLFKRARVSLDDRTEAEAYVMSADQVRGQRRVRGGIWLERFRPNAERSGAWSSWARGRSRKR